jgi:uncharacterized protein YqjF (DUF2071 family)
MPNFGVRVIAGNHTTRGTHRPWSQPRRPWVMKQTWHDLLFAHWPVEPEHLLTSLPPGLRLDLYRGQAWVGVVPFWMSGVLPRGVPDWPMFAPMSTFPELNVRTYVGGPNGEKPGVWFYSLDAENPVAVALARTCYHLPYFRADMDTHPDGEWIAYRSQRTHAGAPPGAFRGRYRPVGPVFHAHPGSLESFLTDRYCLYAADGRGRLYRAEIDHVPWPLQPAEAELELDALVSARGIRLPERPPLLHFARRIQMVGWTPERVRPQTGGIEWRS